MFATIDPTLTVGVAITVTVLLADAEEQGAIPVVVSTNVAVPLNPAIGVHVALSVLASGLKVPPEVVLHAPPVAPPPTEPPRPMVVPP